MIAPSHIKPCTDPVRSVIRYAEADVPTVHGSMRMIVFRAPPARDISAYDEHMALVFGNPLANPEDVLLRVHSECLTSEVFGSLKCDCREQLDESLAKIREKGAGMIIYLRQEGRGIGLGNKIRAYALQAKGADTVDANHQVGFETDLRTYDVAAAMLENLGVRGVSLMTNNPDKIEQLAEHGIRIVRRVPHQVVSSTHSARYMATKRDRLGHLLDLISPVAE
jgi:GTP cyclohydrolase II/3,4-dihydroxy 2-butanone 4-phosphate synthase/GTP cyclohydrolase II